MSTPTVGKGSLERPLSKAEMREICEQGLGGLNLDGRNVLVLIPDATRHAPIGLFFRTINDILGKSVNALDFLVATGTHVAMPMDKVYEHVGITAEEHRAKYPHVCFFNHEFGDTKALTTLGVIGGEEISRLTNGLFSEPIPITINRKAVEYDHILIVSPVVPHEAMGFAGGNKYFFPGIAGIDLVQTFHWLAATVTNPVINGVKDTPTRRVINRAAEFIPTPRTCIALAVNDHDEPMCLFVGDPIQAWSNAADYSMKLHVSTVDTPFHTVLAVTPPIYEDLWVGGKAVYKLEPAVAEGGEIIVYAPAIKTISFMHEAAIRRIGYHVRDYFVRQWEKFSGEPKLILAHSTNVRGIGSFENGVEHPRIRVTLATSIPRDVCESVNLGWLDYRTIDVNHWRRRARNGDFVADNAGQILYRLSHHTF